MSEDGRVSIGLGEYNEFIISKYKNGEIKTDLLDEIAELKKEKMALIHHNNSFVLNKDLALELSFKRDRMGTDTRQEQAQIFDDGVGSYAGIEDKNYKTLKLMGITKDDTIAYINAQWDIKEAEEKQAAEKRAEETPKIEE